jgi:hypothetical protein
VYDRDEIDAILDEGFVCHLGFVQDGQPFVIPTLYARIDDAVYVHGSAASRMLRPPTAKELKATSILRLPLDEVSAKVRTGPPNDYESDLAVPVWAGVIPLMLEAGEPRPDPRLTLEVAPPVWAPGKRATAPRS